MPFQDKRTFREKVTDTIGNWLWWAKYQVAIANGDDFELAAKKATSAVKKVKPLK